jgi:hypothetical protein
MSACTSCSGVKVGRSIANGFIAFTRKKAWLFEAKTPRRRRACRYRGERPEIGAVNEVWAMDFMAERGAPKSIRVDNGPEFAGRMLDQWAYFNGVALDFINTRKANG